MTNQYWVSVCETMPEASRKLLNEFLLSLKLSNKAKATIVKYKYILQRFLSECRTPVDLLTSDEVAFWFRQFSIDKKPRTIDLNLSCLSTFFQFCLEEEWMTNVVIKKRWRPKIPETLPKYLSEEEYARVKMAAEDFSLRDRALILFLFSSGLRRGELCHLSIDDINLKQRYCKVVGKGSHIRYSHFSTECAIALTAYLDTRVNEPTAPLFMNKFGNPLGPSGVANVLKKAGGKAALTQSFHPHVCRHTYATNMLARGADLGFIAEEMGHLDLNTTRVYAKIPTEDMRSAYHNIMG